MLTADEFLFMPPVALFEGRRPRGMFLDWCRRQPGEFTAQDMADAMGISRQSAASHLSKLYSEGRLEKSEASWHRLAVWRFVK